ncbi:MAG TPA: ABC transporter substrate-binding protein [Alphaproteobacteria bacterium]|jgi:NitT/TauT family transport system substrate-binding protein
MKKLTHLLLSACALFCAAPAAAEKITVGSLPFVSASPVFIAKERGYFAAEGLEVETKAIQAAQAVAVATASGDLDIGVGGLTAGFYNLAGKGALKIIAAQSREEPGYNFVAYVVSMKAWNDGFRSVAQFPGKTVGITTAGSTFHYNLGTLAEKRGFKLDTIKLRLLQSVPNMAAALTGNQVDAILTVAPSALKLQNDGAGKIIGWVHQETPWQLGAVFVAPKTIETRRPMVEKFLRAYVRGTQDYAKAYLQRDASGKRVFGAEAEALFPIMKKYVQPEPTPATVLAGANFIDPEGRLLVSDIYRQVAWYQAQGMVDKSVRAKAILDLSFIKGHFEVPKD